MDCPTHAIHKLECTLNKNDFTVLQKLLNHSGVPFAVIYFGEFDDWFSNISTFIIRDKWDQSNKGQGPKGRGRRNNGHITPRVDKSLLEKVLLRGSF